MSAQLTAKETHLKFRTAFNNTYSKGLDPEKYEECVKALETASELLIEAGHIATGRFMEKLVKEARIK